MKMLGGFVDDKKKNTANAKRVNDRLRRRVKRVERSHLQAEFSRREFFCLLTGR